MVCMDYTVCNNAHALRVLSVIRSQEPVFALKDCKEKSAILVGIKRGKNRKRSICFEIFKKTVLLDIIMASYIVHISINIQYFLARYFGTMF